MNGFIKCTHPHGQAVYIKADKIFSINEENMEEDEYITQKKRTYTIICSSYGDYVHVMETPEEIMKLIKESQNIQYKTEIRLR